MRGGKEAPGAPRLHGGSLGVSPIASASSATEQHVDKPNFPPPRCVPGAITAATLCARGRLLRRRQRPCLAACGRNRTQSRVPPWTGVLGGRRGTFRGKEDLPGALAQRKQDEAGSVLPRGPGSLGRYCGGCVPSGAGPSLPRGHVHPDTFQGLRDPSGGPLLHAGSRGCK